MKKKITFDTPLHVNPPSTRGRHEFERLVGKAFDRAHFTNQGPLVEEFENRVAKHLGVRHCVAVCNATTGIQILARALDLTGEVIVPSFTFIATAHALSWIGLKPVFCDITLDSMNIDPGACEELISDQTSAILGVHLWGRGCDVSALEAIAARHDLNLIYDAAHAFGCGIQGSPIGNFGDAEVLSFHATKAIHTFEGGAIVTNDDTLAERLRLISNFGFSDYDKVDTLGTNGKMSEINAAMGIANLAHFRKTVDQSRIIYQKYKKGLESIPGIELIPYETCTEHNYHYVVTRVSAEEYGRDRDELMFLLQERNVLARRYFYPGCHLSEPYKSGNTPHLPITDKAAASTLVLPSGAERSVTDAEKVCALIAEFRTTGSS